jgi:hypothetical protein
MCMFRLRFAVLDKHPSRNPSRLCRLCIHDQDDDTETREQRFRYSLGYMTPTERRAVLLNLLVVKGSKYHTGVLTSLSNFLHFPCINIKASIKWRIHESYRGTKVSQHYLTKIELFTTC